MAFAWSRTFYAVKDGRVYNLDAAPGAAEGGNMSVQAATTARLQMVHGDIPRHAKKVLMGRGES